MPFIFAFFFTNVICQIREFLFLIFLIDTDFVQVYSVFLFNGQIAQLVEQRTENPRVGSSILSLTILTILYRSDSSVGRAED